MAHYNEPGSFEAQFPAELESVVASRRMVAAALQSWDLNGAVGSDAALTVSELVTNAVQAVRRMGEPDTPHVGLTVAVKETVVEVTVWDADSHPPVPVLRIWMPRAGTD